MLFDLKRAPRICCGALVGLLLAVCNEAQAQNGGVAATYVPPGWTPYVQGMGGGGWSTFNASRTEDRIDLGHMRSLDRGGDDVNRTAFGGFYGGALGILTPQAQPQGLGFDARFAVLGSTTENRISPTTTKFIDFLSYVSAGPSYRAPSFAGVQVPVIASVGLGAGVASFGIKRDDGTDRATTLLLVTTVDLKFAVTPNVFLGGELLFYETNPADFGARSVSYHGGVGLVTVTYAFGNQFAK